MNIQINDFLNLYFTSIIKRTFIFSFLILDLPLNVPAYSQQSLVLNAVQDFNYTDLSSGRGYIPILKFNIVTLPAGISIKNVVLEVYVENVESNWDGDLDFFNLNNQGWNETMNSDSLKFYAKTDSTHQSSGFGTSAGFTRSIDLTNLVVRDYKAAHSFCSILLRDPDDTSHLKTTKKSVLNSDLLHCGDSERNASISFLSRKKTDPLHQTTLTISYCMPTDTSFFMKACDSAIINHQSYTFSGNYTQVLSNAANCDSTIHINLLVTHAIEDTIRQIACDSVVINHQTYKTTGNYRQLLTHFGKCDSTLVLELNINHRSTDTLRQTFCDHVVINNETYSSGGIYVQQLFNSQDCDSILVLILTLLKIDTSVTQNEMHLTANESNASYQWIDCDHDNTPVPLEINQSFTAKNSGNYAVIISKQGCSETSSCYPITITTHKSIDPIKKD